jgi:hypothetical protein
MHYKDVRTSQPMSEPSRKARKAKGCILRRGLWKRPVMSRYYHLCGRLAKQCWLEQAETAGVAAHEQLNEAHGTVLVTKSWPENI